jgi:hypothetical protein
MSYKYVFIIIFTLILSNFAQTKSQVLSTGEFLEYNVSYLGVSIANIKVYNDGNELYANSSAAKIRANVFTYSHIPLVNAKAKMEAWVDRRGLFSHQFIRNLSLRSKPWEFQKITFDYNKHLLTNQKWVNNKSVSLIRYEFDRSSKIHDALGLFFKMRSSASASGSTSILTYLDEVPISIFAKFDSKKEKISVDGVSGNVRSITGSGRANWQKQYGLTGGFEAWFSDDGAKIPLLVKADFIIGSIRIELVKYKRSDWTPPR